MAAKLSVSQALEPINMLGYKAKRIKVAGGIKFAN